MSASVTGILGAWALLNVLGLLALAVLLHEHRPRVDDRARELTRWFAAQGEKDVEGSREIPEAIETLLEEAERGDCAARPRFAVVGGNLPQSGIRASRGVGK